MIKHRTEDGHTFNISYKEMKQHYIEFCEMTDDQFAKNLPEAAHLACIISWFKELSSDMTLGDTGIVHELIHLIDGTERRDLPRIREMFKEYLQLV